MFTIRPQYMHLTRKMAFIKYIQELTCNLGCHDMSLVWLFDEELKSRPCPKSSSYAILIKNK